MLPFVSFSDAKRTTGDPTRMYETLGEISGEAPYEIPGGYQGGFRCLPWRLLNMFWRSHYTKFRI